MGYLCLSCYEEYSQEGLNLQIQDGWNYMCPKIGCCGYVVEIDDLLLPVIKLLNQKGYITNTCCSGHSYQDGYCNTYITFYDDCLPENLPKDFILEDDEYYKNNYGNHKKLENITCIRKYYDKKLNEKQLHMEICKTMIDLMKWAMKLEDISDC
jgi:hypothetical protein